MKQKITITDNEMTRFSLTMNEALDFILEATNIGKGSEVFVPKLKAYSIGNLKESIIELLENTGEEKISVRAGEKMHEVMINSDEIQHTWEIGNKYVIFNPLKDSNEIMRDYSKIKKAQFSNGYSSDLANMLTKDELKKIIIKAGLLDVVNFKK